MMEQFSNEISGETVEIATIPIFATPLIVTKFPKHESYEWKSFDKVVRKPDIWFTPLNTSFPDIKEDDPYVDYETAENVKRDVLEHCQKVLACYNMPVDIRYNGFWYNAYYEENGQEPHDHLSPDNLNPYWSGIYFANNCCEGQLTFQKTDLSMRTQQLFKHSDSKICDYYEELWTSYIHDGHILLFPPHLKHAVKVGKENRNKMRLTFSFNLAINRSAYLPDEYFRNESASD